MQAGVLKPYGSGLPDFKGSLAKQRLSGCIESLRGLSRANNWPNERVEEDGRPGIQKEVNSHGKLALLDDIPGSVGNLAHHFSLCFRVSGD